jgi:hypothetical protein
MPTCGRGPQDYEQQGGLSLPCLQLPWVLPCHGAHRQEDSAAVGPGYVVCTYCNLRSQQQGPCCTGVHVPWSKVSVQAGCACLGFTGMGGLSVAGPFAGMLGRKLRLCQITGL